MALYQSRLSNRMVFCVAFPSGAVSTYEKCPHHSKMCCFYDFFFYWGLVFLIMNTSWLKGDFDDFHLAKCLPEACLLVYSRLWKYLDQRRNVFVTGRHVFATSLHLVGLALVHYECHILFQFPVVPIEDCCTHADLLPVHNMACQLDKDFHLAYSVTWMGEVFPSIASSAQHKLVMVAIHQSWFEFVFLSIVRLANILQIMV